MEEFLEEVYELKVGDKKNTHLPGTTKWKMERTRAVTRRMLAMRIMISLEETLQQQESIDRWK